MKCQKCGRELKNEDSIKHGLGPKCFKLNNPSEKKEEKKQIRGYFYG